jgi:hypothetical protein
MFGTNNSNKTILVYLIIMLVAWSPIILFSVSMIAKADEGATAGLSEAVKQNADGTKVRLSGEKIDVDITKGTTTYQNGVPVLNGYITNFTPDRTVTNMTFQLTFGNKHMLVFPLNHANTVVNIPPWQTLQWNHILTPEEQKTVNPPDPNKYSTSVIYNEIDIFKQHAQQQEILLLNQIRSNATK